LLKEINQPLENLDGIQILDDVKNFVNEMEFNDVEKNDETMDKKSPKEVLLLQ
jgi:hypothetical protein